MSQLVNLVAGCVKLPLQVLRFVFYVSSAPPRVQAGTDNVPGYATGDYIPPAWIGSMTSFHLTADAIPVCGISRSQVQQLAQQKAARAWMANRASQSENSKLEMLAELIRRSEEGSSGVE